jgi:predicted alpha/beta superfamily hydrolase
LKKLFPALLLLCICSTGQAQTPPPYFLDNTEVHALHANDLKRDYDIQVSLPLSYKTSTRSYPVLFVTDAPYAFPVTRAIGKRVGDTGGGLEEFIVVGLGYGKGETSSYSRRRDYTPTASPDTTLKSDMPGRPVLHGQAEGYRRFIAADVFPLIASRYRADMKRKVFIGHSYGSLLGLHMLFSDPSMFDQYILGSPSLWYGKRVMFEREKAYAATHKDLKARIYLGVGQLEQRRAGDSDSEDMVGDMKQLETILKSRRYPGLRIESRVFADEDHFTVAPHIITRGLKWLLPPAK